MSTLKKTHSETLLTSMLDPEGAATRKKRGWGACCRCLPSCNAESKYVKFSGPNILSYNLDWLIWYGWIMPSEASFLHNKRMFFTQLAILAFATLLAYVKCPDGPPAKQYCIPLSENFSALTLVTVASFIITTITSITIARWWSTRIHVNSVGGRIKNIVMFVSSSTTRGGSVVSEQVRHVIRLLNLGHSIMYCLANGPLSHDAIEPLASSGLCTVEEGAILATCSDPLAVVYGWACVLLDDLCHVHHSLSEATLQSLQGQMAELRNNSADTLLYIHTQLPYAVVQLISVVVFSFLLQLILVSAGVIGSGMEHGDVASVGMGYFTLALVSFIYLGLLNLHSEVSNPLGDDPCDFPSLAYQEGLLAATDAMRRLIPTIPARPTPSTPAKDS